MFCFIFSLFGFAILNSAEASIFSSVINWLGGNEADTGLFQSGNSQTMPVLQAPLNFDLPTALGGADPPTIVDENSLLAVVGPEGSIADIVDKVPSDQISIYVVQKGDNLAQIAEMFGVSVNTIIWANNLNRGDIITEGQTLIILPVSGIRYEVKEGDTIASIAKKWKGDTDEIVKFNDLSPNQSLVVGTTIIIPSGEAAAPSSTYTPTLRGGSGPYYTDYYIPPLADYYKTQGLHGYNAVDLASNYGCGAPVLASHSGEVIADRTGGWNGGYGNFIIINHDNGTQTLYAHMISTVVGIGWNVARGQVIGYEGATGNSTGCHVHFEVRGAKNPF